MRLLITRHGETKGNTLRILAGVNDTLTKKGIRQAKKLAVRLKDEHIDIIFSSPMSRARKTAEIISKFHNESKFEISNDIRELDFGSSEGKKLDEIDWNNAPSDVETRTELHKRAKKFLSMLLKQHKNDTVLMVSHQALNKALIRVLKKIKPNSKESIRQANTNLTIFEVNKKSVTEIMFNSVLHLEEDKIFKLFSDIQSLNVKSKNDLFVGFRNGKKYLIKKYIIRKGRKKDDLLKIKCEIACYNNIKTLNLPKVFFADYKRKLLIRKFMGFENIELTEYSLKKIIHFYENSIQHIKADFLPKINFSYYENNLFRMFKELKSKKIINNLDIIKIFKKNRQLIDSSCKSFSHGDLHLGNIKINDGKISIIDLEHARIDNRMYDLATLYIDISHMKISDFFLKEISKLQGFDTLLFELMKYRRCIEVIYGLQDNPQIQQYKNAMKIYTQKNTI
jgi:broad specificity phosphatase PhoE